jgi:transposase
MVRRLTDAEWAVVGPLLPAPRRRADGRGRPWRDARAVLDGVLWVLQTGAPWHALPAGPRGYPPYQTCHRRFQQWVRAGALERVVRALATALERRGALDLTECFTDGSFVRAKKGGPPSPSPRGGRARAGWRSPTGTGGPSRPSSPAPSRTR